MTSQQCPLYHYIQHEKFSLAKSLDDASVVAHKNILLNLYQQGWDHIAKHGDFKRWQAAFAALPLEKTNTFKNGSRIKVGQAEETSCSQSEITAALKALCPWRKGPFQVFGVNIDAEWRSDWKWQRVYPHISPLWRRKVLDIGCGSGYHLWRMLEAGASFALGIDTSPLFAFHFATIKRYQPQAQAFYIPAGIDAMPEHMRSFDTVFSMGILYHRKEPLSHLLRIKELLISGGEMVLETLVVNGDETTCLMPKGRYAKMRNVWFIPSVAMLTLWLERLGFHDIRCVDVNTTSIEEQRVTDWMQFESLADYLDPQNTAKTIEGYPAPKRAILVARV